MDTSCIGTFMLYTTATFTQAVKPITIKRIAYGKPAQYNALVGYALAFRAVVEKPSSTLTTGTNEVAGSMACDHQSLQSRSDKSTCFGTMYRNTTSEIAAIRKKKAGNRNKQEKKQ
jgi:hypothetical protein